MIRALLRTLAVVAILLLAGWPQPAQAHARVIATDPADGQVLAAAPAVLTVTFSEPVTLAPSGNELLDATGTPIPAAFTTRDAVLTIEPEETLGDGTHVVAWRVVSADTHPIGGGFTFSIGAPSDSVVAVALGTEEREVEVARVIATGLQYGGVLGLAGLAGFVVLIAPAGVRRDPPAGWWRAGLGFGVVAAAGSVVLVPVTVLWESAEPLSHVVRASTWADAWPGPTAVASLVVGGGTAVAAVGLRRRRDLPLLVGAAGALAALVAVGHTRSYGPSWLVVAADLAHLAAAAGWWGGLIALVLALRARPALRPRDRAVLVSRFSTVAAGLVVALVVAGGVLYWRIGHSFDGLWGTSYGRAVLAKSAIVLPVLALAGWNRWRLLPRVRTAGDARGAAVLARTVRAEAFVLVAAVAVTAVLVTLTPPAREAPVAEPPPVERPVEIAVGDDHSAAVVVAPARRGLNGVRLTVTDATGGTVALASPPSLSFRLLGTSVGPLNRPVSRTEAGVWEATVDLPLAGTWEVSVAVPLDTFEEPVVTGRVEVP